MWYFKPSQRPQRTSRNPARARLSVEALETRAVPAVVGDPGLALQSGDFNNDGHTDLVATGVAAAGNIVVRLGNGDGTFQADRTTAAPAPRGYYPKLLALGDFNRDGRLDLVTTLNKVSWDGNGVPPLALQPRLLLGTGDGFFQPAIAFGPTEVRDVAAGDMNNDRILDVVVVAWPLQAPTITAHVLLGNGDGSFRLGGSRSNVGDFNLAALADFNRDGNLDVLSRSGRLMLGNGNGTLRAPTSTSGSVKAVADFNGDDKLDLLAGSRIHLGNGDGTFQAAAGSVSVGSGVDVADFNGDGRADLVSAYPGSNFLMPGTVRIRLGNGDGTFRDPLILVASPSPNSTLAADFNGDGLPDVAFARVGGIGVLMNDGSF
jgi:hypothetical protein